MVGGKTHYVHKSCSCATMFVTLSLSFFPIRRRIELALIIFNLFVGVVVGLLNRISVNRDSNISRMVISASRSRA